jgi:hypothetical protein
MRTILNGIRPGLRGVLAATFLAVLSPGTASADSDVAVCRQPFTVCLWPGMPANQAVDVTGHRKFKRFLRLIGDLSKSVHLRYERLTIVPNRTDGRAEQCGAAPLPEVQLDAVAAALQGDGVALMHVDNVKHAAGLNSDVIEDRDAPGCGYAFRFSLDTSFRVASEVCGFDILLADDGWPTDASASTVFRPLTWNDSAVVIGAQATVRLVPRHAGPVKPVAWVQLIAVTEDDTGAASPQAAIGLLSGETQFDVETPVTIRIGCSDAQIVSQRSSSYPAFTGKAAANFMTMVTTGQRGIGPELKPVDLGGLTLGRDDAEEPPCDGTECGALTIAFEPE